MPERPTLPDSDLTVQPSGDRLEVRGPDARLLGWLAPVDGVRWRVVVPTSAEEGYEHTLPDTHVGAVAALVSLVELADREETR